MTYKPFDLQGKVALVTGGNSGIGLGMAEALAQAGADIVIWGTNREKNDKAQKALKTATNRVLAQSVDVTDENAVDAAFAEAVSTMRQIDTVIAAAGVGGGGAPSFAETGTDTYRRILSVNLDGTFFTFRAACRHIVERAAAGKKGGSLIAISSLSALEGAARNQAYAATKGAVVSIVRGIAVEYARYGVRANAVLPGWIATEMTTRSQANEKFNERVIGRVPARRWGTPADFGGVAVYLASDASAFHSGGMLAVDGAYSIF